MMFAREYGGPPKSPQVRALLVVLDTLLPSLKPGRPAPSYQPVQREPLYVNVLRDGEWHPIEALFEVYRGRQSAMVSIRYALQRGLVERRGERLHREYRLKKKEENGST